MTWPGRMVVALLHADNCITEARKRFQGEDDLVLEWTKREKPVTAHTLPTETGKRILVPETVTSRQ